MTGLTSLAALEGQWALRRSIVHATGARQRFEGTARFAWDGDILRQDEAGELHGLPGGQPIRGTRRYLWRQAGGRIEVLFPDMRPFHSIPLGDPRPDATHHCPPDIYRVAYDFADPAAWTATWRVEGPRKSYVMESDFRRIGAADEAG